MRAVRKIAAAGARQVWLWRHGRGEMASVEQPRLFVDVSTIIQHDAHTGIQRVVRAVWSELRRRSGNGFLLQPVFATKTHGYCCLPSGFLTSERREQIAEPVTVRPGDKFLGLDLCAHLLPLYRRQLRSWKEDGATIHLMVYDLLPMLRPEWFNATTVANFRRWSQVLANDADQAICISEQVVHDLTRHLAGQGSGGPLVVRVKMGADIGASVPSTGVSREVSDLLERLRFRPAILMVGTIEPRKGYEAALEAFEWLWRTRPGDAPDLVIVGRPGWKTPALQEKLRSHAEKGARLHWLTGVSDEGLCRLYDACTGVLIGSYGEGFGLPLVEAALFRRHVLARDLPVFREQRLPNVTYFIDESPAALAERLVELVSSGKAGPAPSATLPTWSHCVDGLLQEMGVSIEQYRETDSSLRRAS